MSRAPSHNYLFDENFPEKEKGRRALFVRRSDLFRNIARRTAMEEFDGGYRELTRARLNCLINEAAGVES